MRNAAVVLLMVAFALGCVVVLGCGKKAQEKEQVRSAGAPEVEIGKGAPSGAPALEEGTKAATPEEKPGGLTEQAGPTGGAETPAPGPAKPKGIVTPAPGGIAKPGAPAAKPGAAKPKPAVTAKPSAAATAAKPAAAKPTAAKPTAAKPTAATAAAPSASEKAGVVKAVEAGIAKLAPGGKLTVSDVKIAGNWAICKGSVTGVGAGYALCKKDGAAWKMVSYGGSPAEAAEKASLPAQARQQLGIN